MQTISIAHDAVVAKLIDASREVLLLVRETLSYMVDGAAFTNTFAAGGWDGRASFFEMRSATFPRGFVYLVYKALLIKGYKVNLIRNPLPEPLGVERPVVDELGYDPKYDYQPQVADALVRHGQIIARVATGGGKSRCALIAYKRIDRPTMFLTTRSLLLHQMRRSVESMGEGVSIIGDGFEWPENPTKFTCAMVQTLSQAIEPQFPEMELERFLKNRQASEDREVATLIAALKKAADYDEKNSGTKARMDGDFAIKATKLRDSMQSKRDSDRAIVDKIQRNVIAHNAHRLKVLAFLKTRELVISEEAHEASGEGYYRTLQACAKAHYRLALTATPFMKDSSYENMRLMGCSGPVAITITEKELIDRGVLATPYFKFTPLTRMPEGLFRSTPWTAGKKGGARGLGIVNCVERNAHIAFEAKRASLYGLTTMVLVTQKVHGRVLQSLLTRAGLRVNFIFGEHDQDDRQAALNALAIGKLDVLIGSTILDVGVDVPSVGLIIIGGGGKAEVGTRQRIGRGLRSKKNGPNVAFILDFTDSWNTTLRDHAIERRAIVESTPGFGERILTDFPYEQLGLTRKAT